MIFFPETKTLCRFSSESNGTDCRFFMTATPYLFHSDGCRLTADWLMGFDIGGNRCSFGA